MNENEFRWEPLRKPLVLVLRTTQKLTKAMLKLMNIFTLVGQGQGHQMYKSKTQKKWDFRMFWNTILHERSLENN